MTVFGSSNVNEVELETELENLGFESSKIGLIEESIFSDTGNTPTQVPTKTTLLVRRYELNNNVTTIHSVWLYTAIEGGNGFWSEIFNKNDGSSAAGPTVSVFNSQFSPNGLFTSVNRGDIRIHGTVNNLSQVNNADAKIWFAINPNSSTSWIELARA